MEDEASFKRGLNFNLQPLLPPASVHLEAADSESHSSLLASECLFPARLGTALEAEIGWLGLRLGPELM